MNKALVTIMHNTKDDTYHPIYFYHSPRPSEDFDDDGIRMKSGGHLTLGLNLDAAITECQKLSGMVEAKGFSVVVNPYPRFQWDGVESPAIVYTESASLWKESAIAVKN